MTSTAVIQTLEQPVEITGEVKRQTTYSLMNITSVFYAYCEEVLSFLEQEQVRIPEKRIQHMKQTVANSILYDVDNNCEYVELRDNAGTAHGAIRVKNLSQVIDCPPVFVQQELREIAPVVVLYRGKKGISRWTFIHEICHLLSIGPYVKQPNMQWIHHFGILCYRYRETEQKLGRISMNGHVGINELLNDYIVWRIMESTDASVKAPYHGLEIFRTYIDSCCCRTDIQSLIGSYFSGEVKQVEEYLLNKRYASFSELYEGLTPS